MKITQEKSENGRLHLKTKINVAEIEEYLEWVPKSIQKEGDIPTAMLNASVQEMCENNLLQTKIRSSIMNLAASEVLKIKDIIPVSQLIFLTKDQVRPGQSFEFIVSTIPKPKIQLSDYGPIRSFSKKLFVSDEEIDDEVAYLAEQSSCFVLRKEKKKIKPSDYVELETTATRESEIYEPLTAKKRFYKLGEQFLPESFDENLVGMSVGERKSFSLVIENGSSPIEVIATILGIYDKVVPKPNDEWVNKCYPNMGGLHKLKDRIRHELLERKRPFYKDAEAEAALSQLIERVVSKVPENVFEASFSEAYRRFCKEIKESQGQTIEEYFYKRGITEQQFKESLASDVHRSLLQGLALDSYAAYHGITSDEKDYQQALNNIAPGDEHVTHRYYEESGRGYLIDEAALRTAALKHLLAKAA